MMTIFSCKDELVGAAAAFHLIRSQTYSPIQLLCVTEAAEPCFEETNDKQHTWNEGIFIYMC